MEVYLLESYWGVEVYTEVFLHLPETDIWLTNVAYSGERIENQTFTNLFWTEVEEKQSNLLTHLGDL